MRKPTLKRTISCLALTALCASMSFPAFADTVKKDPNPGRAELKEYREVISEKRSSLGELISQSQELSSQIKGLQKSLKEAGLLTDENSQTLSQMSDEIRDARQKLTEIRTKVNELKVSGDAYIANGDYESAKSILSQVADTQDEQISLRQTLSDLLKAKVNFLTSFESSAE